MLNVDKEKLITAWIALEYAEEGSQEYDRNFWSTDILWDLCEYDPEVCWDLIEEIRKKDGSDIILANLAAGPLEDLMAKHGQRFIDRVEKQAQTDPQFKKMLGAVWQNVIPEDIWERLQRVAGPSF